MFELLDIHPDWLYTLGSFAGGGALGGLISSIVNRKENKRIKKSEAVQSEATAKREDAKAATEMMGLLEQPELALDPDISALILVEGIILGKSSRGDFTGLSLENYFNTHRDDPFGARRIVNGLDHAPTIAGYHYKFLEAIRKAL